MSFNQRRSVGAPWVTKIFNSSLPQEGQFWPLWVTKSFTSSRRSSLGAHSPTKNDHKFWTEICENWRVCLCVIFCLPLTCENGMRVSIQFELSAGGAKRDVGKPPNVSWPQNPRSAARRLAQDLNRVPI